MQIKKNPKKDLRRWSLIFFQLGLVLVLLISWRAIERKTYEKEEEREVEVVKFTDLEPEDVVVTETPKTNTPPPPPPPKAPEVIQVVEDDEEIEEDEVETVEDIPEEKVEVADISEIESAPDEGEIEEEIESVPFQAIQDVPVFPGCEKYDSDDKKRKCMNDGIQKFVNRRFNTELAADLGLSGVTRINVQFTVDENGEITDIMARATESALEEEAKRVVQMLPSMEPGKQRGKAVKVIYQLPIAFQVN